MSAESFPSIDLDPRAGGMVIRMYRLTPSEREFLVAGACGLTYLWTEERGLGSVERDQGVSEELVQERIRAVLAAAEPTVTGLDGHCWLRYGTPGGEGLVLVEPAHAEDRDEPLLLQVIASVWRSAPDPRWWWAELVAGVHASATEETCDDARLLVETVYRIHQQRHERAAADGQDAGGRG